MAWWIYKRSRFDAEPAPYILLRRDKSFELRRYPSLPVASTPIRGDNDEAFMRLFRFIDRGSETTEKIAMTAPVFYDGQPGAQEKMSLVMPRKTARAGVPAPSAATVTLEERPAQRVAVYRFTGGTCAERRRAVHSGLSPAERGHASRRGVEQSPSPRLRRPMWCES